MYKTANYSNSTIISISTVASKGRLTTPIAILECLPMSPNISNNKSDAAFMTKGCFVKSSVEFTKPDIGGIDPVIILVPTILVLMGYMLMKKGVIKIRNTPQSQTQAQAPEPVQVQEA